MGSASSLLFVCDITGFGLLGHALEIARASGLAVQLNTSALPWLPGVRELAAQGIITGASGRNWDSYGTSIKLSANVDDTLRALLCDPQTSGGLLVACAPETAAEVLDVFQSEGFEHAALIGELREGMAEVRVG